VILGIKFSVMVRWFQSGADNL